MKLLLLLALFMTVSAAAVVKLPIQKHVPSAESLELRKLVRKPASPKFQNFNKPASPKLQNFNKPASPKFQNFNKPTSSNLRPQRWNEPASPKFQNFNKPASSKFQHLNEPASPKFQNFNQPASPKFQDFNKPASPKFQDFNKPASPKFQILNKPASPKFQKFNKPASSNLRPQRLNKSSQPLMDFWDGLYIANISLGTPPQSFRVMIDTGYFDLVVVDSSCTSADECDGDPQRQPAYKKHKYQHDKSSTYKYSGEEAFRYDDDGFNFYGMFMYDDLQISGLVAKKFLFAGASSISDLMNIFPLDGVLGLGRPYTKGKDEASLLQNLLPQLDEQIFTIYLGKQKEPSADEIGGQITFGAVDTENCEAPVVFTPLTAEYYWAFTLDSYTFGKYKSLKSYRATVASGVYAIEGPLDEIYQIYKQINAQYDPNEGTYTVACDAVKDIPDLVFTVNGVDLAVPANAFITQLEYNCGVWLVDIEESDYDWRFGSPFVQTWCNVHDIGKGQIGFGKAIHKSV